MSFDQLTDDQLLTQIADYAEQEKAAKNAAEPLRTELLRRMTEHAVMGFDAGGWEAALAKEPMSLAWLKRQTGYEMEDLPEGIVTEKIVPDLDGAALLAWLMEEGGKDPTTYSLRIKRQKAAV